MVSTATHLALVLALATAALATGGAPPSEETCDTPSCGDPSEEAALVQKVIKRHGLGNDLATRGGSTSDGGNSSLADSHSGSTRRPMTKSGLAPLPSLGGVGGAERIFKLVKMDAKASSMGAVCLDGTPGAFYISPAPVEHQKRREWMIHLQGGGWCYDEPSCYNRSAFLGGSSWYALPNQTGHQLGLDGFMSDNCTVNPTFCNFNLVMAWYCDGASFAGNKEDPVVFTDPNGTKHNLWFRGRRILDALLDTLVEDYDLAKASRVLLGGDSAGGMAAFLHANYVQSRLKIARRKYGWFQKPMDFRVAPNSGFFLYHGSVEMKAVWQVQMYYLYYMANMTISNNDCLAVYSNYQLQHLCLYPQNVYPFIKAPIFVLNSALDLYQTANFLAAEPITGFPNWQNSEISFWSGYNSSAAPGWANCSGGMVIISMCSEANILAMNGYMDSFEETITSLPAFRKRGNGAFIYGCFNHNAEMNSLDWGSYAVDGVVMRDAVAAWWHSSKQCASRHSYVEKGRYKYPADVTDANPTCNWWADGLR